MADYQTISNGELSAAIDPEGAQLRSLRLGEREYLWQADPRWWGRSAPVLFPIVGTLRNDHATSVQGPCNMPRHGLARRHIHEVASNDGGAVSFRLESTDETRTQYPYDFRLEMTFSLEGAATLAQSFAVTNTGTVDMPFCLGGHPAFNVPVADGERFEDYALTFASRWTATTPVITPDGLLSYDAPVQLFENADRLPLTHELFANDALVLQDVPEGTLTMAGPSGHGVRMDFAEFDHIGIWSAAADAEGVGAPFVALEPWCGTATRTDEDDTFEHKQNVIVAAPGETVTRTFRITLL